MKYFEKDYPNGVIKVIGSKNCGATNCTLEIRALLSEKNSQIEAWTFSSPHFIQPMFDEIKTIKGIILLSELHTYYDGMGMLVQLTNEKIESIRQICKERKIPLLEIPYYDKEKAEDIRNWVVREILK